MDEKRTITRGIDGPKRTRQNRAALGPLESENRREARFVLTTERVFILASRAGKHVRTPARDRRILRSRGAPMATVNTIAHSAYMVARRALRVLPGAVEKAQALRAEQPEAPIGCLLYTSDAADE